VLINTIIEYYSSFSSTNIVKAIVTCKYWGSMLGFSRKHVNTTEIVWKKLGVLVKLEKKIKLPEY
jgi:hypothetical protein